MTNNKQQTPHGFCETPEQKCTMNYCDENGCQNRKRTLTEPTEMPNNKQQTVVQLIIQALDIECKSRGMNVNWDMYLEKEREQIAKAFDDGDYNYHYSRKTGDDFEDGKEYFNEIYG
jgi:hypothetical protein